MGYSYNIMLTIVSSLIVILLAFFVTKLIASRYTNVNHMSKNMKIIDKLNLGVDKQLAIVAIKDSYYLISITKMGIDLIDKLEDLDITPYNLENKSIDFKEILNGLRNKNR